MIQEEFHDRIFKQQSWIERDLKGALFSRIVFEHCDFSRSDLSNARFQECKFINCNWSLAKVAGCRLQDVEFDNCKLLGIDFFQCDKMFFRIQCKKCLLSTSNFSGLDLRGASFQNCILREVFFTESNLSEADFSHSNLAGTVFHNSNLIGANFCGAINYSINPMSNQIKKAKFSTPEALSLLDHFDIIIEN